MERESRVRKQKNHDAVCFHAQQCCEKYLKACLLKAGKEPKKIHDLSALLEQVILLQPEWNVFRTDMAWLTQFGVSFRYPGESANAGFSNDAGSKCRKFRLIVRKSFNFK
ncbi:MAG: hypothetical protein A2X45_05075 [Lentisphaerae bacterium GWF2_50_93]|nr:MAG: hypothetical protein A2X45_05075 [Lentisphaerae bacterium GWF2_50_93]